MPQRILHPAASWLAGWRAGWLAGWLVGYLLLAGWLSGMHALALEQDAIKPVTIFVPKIESAHSFRSHMCECIVLPWVIFCAKSNPKRPSF